MTHAPVFSRIITLAALAGLVPFVVGLGITLVPESSPIDDVIFERAMLGYGALILSFLGGVRWGLRLQGGAGSDLIFLMGILGAFGGFFILILPYTLSLVLLTIGFAAQGAWDVFSGGMPLFYAKLRGMMTWIVCLLLLAILIARAFI